MTSLSSGQARAAVPFIAPMLARPGSLPRDPAWALEVKWDGMRAQVRLCGGVLSVRSRQGRDWTSAFPELAPLADSGHAELLLDGELVCLDADGRPDFGRLRARLHPGRPIGGRADRPPATLMIFDILHLDGEAIWLLPYRERRARLDALALEGPAWRTPRAFCSASEDLAAATRAHGLEGVVAKRRDAPYQPGPRRTGAWLKIKHRHAEHLAVVGWRPGRSREPDGIVVARRAGRRLTPAGVVHFGPPDEQRRRLLEQLRALQPRGVRRTDRVRELAISMEVHHHGRPGGQLRDAIAHRVQQDPPA